MAHIALDDRIPGLPSLLAFRPETAGPLASLAETLLRGEGPLDRGERELIASYVSELNGCRFCSGSHGACAAVQLPGGTDLVRQVHADLAAAPVSVRLRALLGIAAAVQRGGREVGDGHVAAAREAGATDVEIHDTVLIAAAFCMFNRYVDGLGTSVPTDPSAYARAAERLTTDGYTATLRPPGDAPAP